MTSGVTKKQNKKDCKYEEPDGRIESRCCKEPPMQYEGFSIKVKKP